MRKPLRTTPSGIAANTKINRWGARRRKRYDARTLAIRRTQLDRMPLHSCATSGDGARQLKAFAPSRNTGIPVRLRKKLAQSAEASLEAFSRHSTTAFGKGVMKSRKANGKAAAFIQRFPTKTKPPATRKQTKDNILRVSQEVGRFHATTRRTGKAVGASRNFHRDEQYTLV